MAPRGRRSKVGLTRMAAAVDAMRPMGFSSDVIRKCVRKLLKVYGDDGWAFFEDAAYKILIDTILEELEQNPEPEQELVLVEGVPEQELALVEGVPEQEHTLQQEHGNNQLMEFVPELWDDEIICGEEDPNTEKQGSLELDLDVQPTPMLVQDVDAQSQVGIQPLGFAMAYTPQVPNGVSTNRKRRPCYGWISDDDVDEDDDCVQLPPA